MYCRQGVNSGSFYYYQAIKINVLTSGYYSISSNSSMDTYGYLYNGTFDPSSPSESLILHNDDGAGYHQLRLTYFLQCTGTYIVIVTTYPKNVTEAFSLIAAGKRSVTFNDK